MPSELSERPEELVRQYLTDSLRPAEIEGYDPNQTDTSQSDFLPITNDWSYRGDYYPIISVRETDGPSIPNAGNTNYNGVQGNGSGNNQYTIYPITVSCQAVQVDGTSPYRNSTSAETLVFKLYNECHAQVQEADSSAITDAIFIGMTPPTVTRSNEETDSGSTITWLQRQGTINMGVLNTPE